MSEFQKNEDEVGALWEKSGRGGPYMSGEINGQRVVVFRNDKKRSEKAPDWRVLKAKPKEDEAPF